MEVTLPDIVQAYLEDQEFQQRWSSLATKRDASIPKLQDVTLRFVRAELAMKAFCSQLEKTLRSDEDWGATSFGFMMELNKLNKYHNETSSLAEEHLRETLHGLNKATLGDRIEEFYDFLLKERERLRHEGKSGAMIVSASRSPFILSLFAFWLDPEKQPIIYYDSLRKGLHTLIKAGTVPESPGLTLGPTAIEIRTAADHRTVEAIVTAISQQVPQLHMHRYWIEFFCLWVTKSFAASLPVLVKEVDDSAILATKPTKTAVQESTQTYNWSLPQSRATASPSREIAQLIDPEPLKPTPEPLLTHLIHEVQRHILIDEAVIRHLYYALLDGHVILTGPPGTGKTELARLIPEILWQSEAKEADTVHAPENDGAFPSFTTETAYTTRLVTATDDWSTRTLISGIVPQSKDGAVIYKVQFGHLTSTILKNWSFQGDRPEEWSTLTLQRTRVTTTSGIERGMARTFRGQWLVIDEFNRAPIDLALGDALTALGGHDVLRVAIESGSAELPIPQDFRIIGTLNSFDRNYLNQISEALKRRFSFIEIPPPTRAHRAAEQGIVLYKALKKISHLSNSIESHESSLYWSGVVTISAEPSGHYSMLWDDEASAFREAFDMAWRTFEIIRIYRQLGTAQAISLLRQMLIAGILQGHTTQETWIEHALDTALCSTIADQLQVLLPDEIESLFLYLTTDPAAFSAAYHQLLARLASTPQRLYAQLLALASVHDEENHPYLSDAQIDRIAALDQPEIPAAALTDLFHLNYPISPLPQFTRRLRTFKAERGL
ncbi:MAG TPA: AAA family ATPase [Ktedonobacteraceae bacterium]|jgi:MoxR-like ATPase